MERYTVLTGRDQFEELTWSVYDRQRAISTAHRPRTKADAWGICNDLNSTVTEWKDKMSGAVYIKGSMGAWIKIREPHLKRNEV